MTNLLEQALRAITQLPAADQDAIAVAILAAVNGEERWDRQFAASTQQLERLADEALSEFRDGGSEPLDPDAL